MYNFRSFALLFWTGTFELNMQGSKKECNLDYCIHSLKHEQILVTFGLKSLLGDYESLSLCPIYIM